MKKYPIKFTKDYARLELPSPSGELYSKYVRGTKEQIALCQKWKGQSITLEKLEQNRNQVNTNGAKNASDIIRKLMN